MNIIELKANEIAEVFGGFETVLVFIGGKAGILSGALLGVFDYLIGKHGFGYASKLFNPKVMCGKTVLTYVVLVSTVFTAANFLGTATGWFINKPLLWLDLIDPSNNGE